VSVLCFQTVTTLAWPTGEGPRGEVTPAWPLGEVLAGVAGAGLRSVGLDLLSLDAAGREGDVDVASLLRGYGLTCPDVGVLVLDEPTPAMATANRLTRLATQLGARLVIAVMNCDPDAPESLELLRACADQFYGAGARIALEWSPYYALRTLDRAREMCAAVGLERCGLLVDPWMFSHAGDSWASLEDLSVDEIAYLQLNDAPPPIGDDIVFESRHRRVLPGSGTIDVRRFADTIRRTGYDGPVSIEVLSKEMRALPPAEQARRIIATAREFWPTAV
jgi:sugar phosphate isomerase/epimerase